jgi:hypothetical protein
MIDISVINKIDFSGKFNLFDDDNDKTYMPVAFYGKKLNRGELLNCLQKHEATNSDEKIKALLLGIYGITNHELVFNKIGSNDSDAKANLSFYPGSSTQGKQKAFAFIYALPKSIMKDFSNKMHQSEGCASLLDEKGSNHYNMLPDVQAVPYLDSELWNKELFPKVKINGSSTKDLINVWAYIAAADKISKKKIKPSEAYCDAIFKGISFVNKSAGTTQYVVPKAYAEMIKSAHE